MGLFGTIFKVRIRGKNYRVTDPQFGEHQSFAFLEVVIRIRARTIEKAMDKAMAEWDAEMTARGGTLESGWIAGAAPLLKGEKIEKMTVLLAIDAAPFPTEFFDRMSKFSEPNKRLENGIVFLHREPEQFDVVIEWEDGEFTVYAKSWHDHYQDEDQADWAARWLLTPYYRVVEEHRGEEWIASWLERWEAEGWSAFCPIIHYEFRRIIEKGNGAFTLTYSQQAIKDPGDYQSYVPGAMLDDDELPLSSHLGVRTETIPMSVIETAPWAQDFIAEIDAHQARLDF